MVQTIRKIHKAKSRFLTSISNSGKPLAKLIKRGKKERERVRHKLPISRMKRTPAEMLQTLKQ